MTHIACPEGSILRGGINEHTNACLAAFSYPDFTVGPGVSPDPAPNQALAGCTADWELLALTLPRRFKLLSNQSILSPNPDVNKGNFNSRSLMITLVGDLNHNSSVGHQGCYRANRC